MIANKKKEDFSGNMTSENNNDIINEVQEINCDKNVDLPTLFELEMKKN